MHNRAIPILEPPTPPPPRAHAFIRTETPRTSTRGREISNAIPRKHGRAVPIVETPVSSLSQQPVRGREIPTYRCPFEVLVYSEDHIIYRHVDAAQCLHFMEKEPT